jgi:hypothetical protein
MRDDETSKGINVKSGMRYEWQFELSSRYQKLRPHEVEALVETLNAHLARWYAWRDHRD